MEFTRFCSTCKRTVTVVGESRKDAERRFHQLGHDDRKVSRLARGPVGFYKTAEQLKAEHEAAEARRAAQAAAEVAEVAA